MKKRIFFWFVLGFLGFAALVEHRRLRRFIPKHEEIRDFIELDKKIFSDIIVSTG